MLRKAEKDRRQQSLGEREASYIYVASVKRAFTGYYGVMVVTHDTSLLPQHLHRIHSGSAA